MAAALIFAAAHTLGRRGGPRLRLPTDAVQLGNGLPATVLSGEFDIENVGRAPLEFELTQGCGCTTLEPHSGVIPIGQAAHVNVGVRLPAAYGLGRSVRINIATNDPSARSASLTVIAGCPPPFVVSPEQLDFGMLSDTQRRALTITVRPGSHAGARLPTRFTLPGTQFVVEHEEREDAELRIDIALSPVVSRLAPDSQNSASLAAECIVWRNDRQKLGQLDAADVPDGWTIREFGLGAGTAPSRLRRFRFEAPGGFDWPERVHVQLRFAETETPAEITLLPPAKHSRAAVVKIEDQSPSPVSLDR